MNSVIFIGRLANEPKLSFLPRTGKAVTKFRIAVPRKYQREGYPEADFFNTVCWAGLAEAVANFTHKGRQVAVRGRIENRKYKTGNENKYISELIAEEIQFLDYPNKPIVRADEEYPEELKVN